MASFAATHQWSLPAQDSSNYPNERSIIIVFVPVSTAFTLIAFQVSFFQTILFTLVPPSFFEGLSTIRDATFELFYPLRSFFFTRFWCAAQITTDSPELTIWLYRVTAYYHQSFSLFSPAISISQYSLGPLLEVLPVIVTCFPTFPYYFLPFWLLATEVPHLSNNQLTHRSYSRSIHGAHQTKPLSSNSTFAYSTLQ